MSQTRPRCPAHRTSRARRRIIIAAVCAGLGIAFDVLTGCSQPLAPVTGSPQTNGAGASGTASQGERSFVGAGSFPRSFLIPGTEDLDPHRRIVRQQEHPREQETVSALTENPLHPLQERFGRERL